MTPLHHHRSPTLTTVALTTLVLLTTFWLFAGTSDPKAEPEPTQSPVDDGQTSGSGVITGSIEPTQGASTIHETVCAQATLGTEPICTTSDTDASFSLSVPAGQYLVYAFAEAAPGTLAYYTLAAQCQPDAPCVENHQPIVVTVQAGEVVEGVTPTDPAR
ncbi:hypothetical protein HY375_00725 [Candidatus Berkelbacteria bacterium]|nr:hypothetical protein [Candidatus Berkelbacteria bacterium]